MDTAALKKQLEGEGFLHVYEWWDEAGVEYEPHAHKGAVTLFITEGGLTFWMEGKELELKAGDRLDVPVGVEHWAKVGPDGCSFVVGEMIEGDS